MEILFIVSVIWFGQFVNAENLYKFKLEKIKSHSDEYECAEVELTEREGFITSPNYPSLYSSHISCSWHISGNVGDVITVLFDDIDIEESCFMLSGPCCRFNWLKVGLLANETARRLCGKNFKYEPFTSSSHKLGIKFHISSFVQGGRGFKLHYKITPHNENECESFEFNCGNNQCIHASLRCNGVHDCKEGTDEQHCPSFPLKNNCKINEFKCGNNQCISAVMRCNGKTDCEDGSDEHHCSTFPVQTNCKLNEFKCGNNQCIPAIMRCNGKSECEDSSDEHHCSNKCASGRSCQTYFLCYDASKYCDGIPDCSDFSDELDCGFCRENFIRCDSNTTQCYNPEIQRCDKIFHCLNGEDEKDCYDLCPGRLMCNSRRSCYSMKDRCNGITQCEDASDEKNCVPELCIYEHGGFLCDNRRCIPQVWTCDHTDDCRDGSDERNCLRNSVLTAAVIGSLICALLLVIAISCTCRLHALRMLEQRLSSRETPLSRLSREFFFREPPPSYAVAVQGSQHHNLYVENLHYGVPVQRGRRRSRRPRHSRSSLTAPPLHSVSRNFVLMPEDTAPSPEAVDESSTGESSNPVPSSNASTVVRPGTKNECVIPVSGENQSVSKDTDDDKDTSVQSDNICPVIRPNSDSESLSLEPINVSLEETSDSVQTADHYYCDSDSEPLVA